MGKLDSAKKIIITQDWGGLGDNLQYSTLPEEFAKKRGEKCVWISNKNAYRYDGIRQLVWDWNPWICGYTDEPPNAGTANGGYSNTHNDHIRGIEAQHGLEPTNSYPKIYYEYSAKPASDFNGSIFIDLTASNSNPQIGNKNIKNQLRHYINNVLMPSGRNIYVVQFKEGFTKYPMQLEPIKPPEDASIPKNYGPSHPDWNVPSKRNKWKKCTRRIFEPYIINDIFEYATMLRYCHTFVCLFSGGNALASAIKQAMPEPHITCFVNSCYIHNWNMAFIYNNVTYVEC